MQRRLQTLLIALCAAPFAAAGAGFMPPGRPDAPILYSPTNIDWHASAVLDESEALTTRVVRASSGGGFAAQSVAAPELVRTRVLSSDGRVIRVREAVTRTAAGATTNETAVFRSGELLDTAEVVCADRAAARAFEERLIAAGGNVIRRYGKGNILRCRLPSLLDWRANEVALAALGGTSAARPAGVRSAVFAPVRFNLPLAEPAVPPEMPDDKFFPQQWHLAKIGATNVWSILQGYPNTPCAVFDTGVRLDHEDLQINVKRRVSAIAGDPANPADHHGHGSHCLGIMGADSNNGKGVCGVGQTANLTSIRGPISYYGAGASILDGYQWAYDNNIRVLSCSFGSAGAASYDAAEEALLGALGENGCIVCIAAGNDGNNNDLYPDYPACYTNDNIVCVIATDKNDNPVSAGWKTNYGKKSTDIGSPGTEIISCTADATNSYASWDGTSMATPIVAAVCGFIREQNPTWGYKDVIRRLYSSAVPVPALNAICSTGARVDLARAIAERLDTITIRPFDRPAQAAGAPLVLQIVTTSSTSLSATLHKLADSSFSRSLGTFAVTPGGATNAIAVWTPAVADVGRGYYVSLRDATDPENIFANTGVFRVRDFGEDETISISVPAAGAKLDAANFTMSFRPSHAVLVDLILVQTNLADHVEVYEKLLDRADVTPGSNQTFTVHLRGNGWTNEEGKPYFLKVVDVDDPSVIGESGLFDFDRSSLEIRVDSPTGNVYRAGTRIPVRYYLPVADQYYIYLLAESGRSQLLKAVTIEGNLDGYNDLVTRSFEVTLPDDWIGERCIVYAYDIYDTAFHASSAVFDVVSNTTATITRQAAVDQPGIAAEDQYDWYATPDSSAVGGVSLRSGAISDRERDVFDVTIAGPALVTFNWRTSSQAGKDILAAFIAEEPHLTSDSAFTEIARRSGSDLASVWSTVSYNFTNEASYTLRFKYEKDASGSNGLDCAWIDDLQVSHLVRPTTVSKAGGLYTAPVRVSLACPTTDAVIYFTLDGSAPTSTAGIEYTGAFTLSQSALLRARAFKPGWVPGDEATARYWIQTGTGAAAAPYTISTPSDLIAFAEAVDTGNGFAGKTVALLNDIDCSTVGSVPSIGFSVAFTETEIDHSFCGTFDGRSNTIWHITLAPATKTAYGLPTAAYQQTQGFFGSLATNAVVHDLVLANATLEPTPGIATVGLFAGLSGGIVSNCAVRGGSVQGYGDSTGGFIGHMIGGLALNCAYSGTVLAVYSGRTIGAAGGFVGNAETLTLDYSVRPRLLASCRAEGSLVAKRAAGYSAPFDVGGFAGRLATCSASNLCVLGTVRELSGGSGGTFGGLVGRLEYATLAHAYTTAVPAPEDTSSAASFAALVGTQQNDYYTLYSNTRVGLFAVTSTLAKTYPNNGTADSGLSFKTAAYMVGKDFTTTLDAEQGVWRQDTALLHGGYPVFGWDRAAPLSPSAIPAFSRSGGWFYEDFALYVTPPVSNAVLYVSTNGVPVPNATNLYVAGTPISVRKADGVRTFIAIAVEPGKAPSAPVTAIYEPATRPSCAKPVFATQSPANFTAMNVGIGTATERATIHYTVDGSMPTTNSPVYAAEFRIRATTTVKAIAAKRGFQTSEVATAVYTRSTWAVKLAVTGGMGSGSYLAGDLVTVSAPAVKGKRFRKWTGTAAALLADVTVADSAFEITGEPNQTLTLAAVYEDLPRQDFSIRVVHQQSGRR